MERLEGQAKTIQSRKSCAFLKPSHGEHSKDEAKWIGPYVVSRENKAGGLQAIRYTRKSLGALLER
jgi:hypothetical protein